MESLRRPLLEGSQMGVILSPMAFLAISGDFFFKFNFLDCYHYGATADI